MGFDWTRERAATILIGRMAGSLTRVIANERAAAIPLSQSEVSALAPLFNHLQYDALFHLRFVSSNGSK